MSEHRVVIDEEKRWDHTASTRHRLHCDGCHLDVKIVGVGAADLVDLICENHGSPRADGGEAA